MKHKTRACHLKLGVLEEHHNKPILFPSCIIKIRGKTSWNVLELINDINSIYENSFSQWHNTLKNRGTETKHPTGAWQEYPFQTNMTPWNKHLTRLAPKHKHFASTLQTFHTANMLNNCARLWTRIHKYVIPRSKSWRQCSIYHYNIILCVLIWLQ